jgi:hypothetical protein
LLSLDAKLSTSPDHYLEIKSNSHNSWEKDY